MEPTVCEHALPYVSEVGCNDGFTCARAYARQSAAGNGS